MFKINVDSYRVVTGKSGNFLIITSRTDSDGEAEGINIDRSSPTNAEFKDFLICIIMEDLLTISFSKDISLRELKNSEKNILISEFEKMKTKFKSLFL